MFKNIRRNLMDKKVEDYINNQKSNQKEIILKVRDIFTKTLKNFNEQFAWGVIVIAGGKFYIAAMKNRVHVGFTITGLNKEEINIFEGSGKTMRHIKIYTKEDIGENKFVKLIKMVDKKATSPPDFKG
jgi:hypothetical protein